MSDDGPQVLAPLCIRSYLLMSGAARVRRSRSRHCDLVLEVQGENGAEGPSSADIADQNGSSSSGIITLSVSADWFRWRAASWMWVP
jgi:hypothetical protein